MTQYKGSTKEAEAPFVTWKKGTEIVGTIRNSFQTNNGPAFTVQLKASMTVEGKKVDRVSFNANKAGIKMALQATGAGEFKIGDRIVLQCIGGTSTDKGNDRHDFALAIDRP